MIATLFIALFVLLFLGTPVFVALGLSAVLALVGFSDLPLMGVAQRLINGVDKFSLLAVPFFIFAANASSQSSSLTARRSRSHYRRAAWDWISAAAAVR